MKAAKGLLFVAALALALTGCVDVVQYLSADGQTVDVYFRLTLQKSAFELANSFSDEPEDLDEMFDEEFGINESEVVEDFPLAVSPEFTPINSENEYGFELRYSAARDVLESTRAENDSFVPQIRRDGLSIPLSGQGESGAEMTGGEGDEFANAFLGGSKYRLLISKKMVSRVSEARLVTPEGATDVLVTDLPDVWMIEFPSSLWLNAPSGTTLEVLF